MAFFIQTNPPRPLDYGNHNDPETGIQKEDIRVRIRFPDLIRLALVAVLALPFLPRDAHSLPSWDLAGDWSDTQNPSGVWSYRDGSALLPIHAPAWQGLSGDFSTAQPAWNTSAAQISSLPACFKSSAAVAIAHDWQTGDVIFHTQDNFNGVGFGPANILWLSPIHGTVNISGAVWEGRDIGRGNHWSLWVRGVKQTEGDISSGDPYSRATPFNLAAGSGGAAVLSGVPVAVGDSIELLLERNSQAGDYVGIQLHLDAATVVAVPGEALAARPWLGAPRPNPAHAQARLAFRLPTSGPISLEVLDLQGRRLRSLWLGRAAAGEHEATWDGRDDRGNRVSSGVYLCRLEAGARVATRRIALIR